MTSHRLAARVQRGVPGRLALVLLALLALLAALGAAPARATSADRSLRVALVTHGTCGEDASLLRLRELLADAGHAGSVVAEDALLREIDAFDVVVLGAGPFLCEWNWRALDETLAPWVRRGGGLVATGWVAYYLADNTHAETYPGLERVLPVVAGTDYHADPVVWAISGHPITDGVTSFRADYDSTGGGPRDGAEPLLRVADTFVGAAWDVDDGRAVYLGPNYLGAWTYYSNELLLDGTQPDAERLLMQSVEWAGRRR